MSERVNRRAVRCVTALLGILGALVVAATASPRAKAAPPPGTPTGSKVEIIFLDGAGRPIQTVREAAPPVDRPAPAPARPTPATPSTAAPRPAASRPAPPLRATTAGAWGASRRRPILGDGSNAAELVAAAQRVVGLRGRADRPIVAHVLTSAGVPLPLPEVGVTNDVALVALVTAGRKVVGAGLRDLAFGDVVFFSGPGDATVRFGVVEGVDPEGRVHLIGESADVVSRFVLTGEHHHLHAVARP